MCSLSLRLTYLLDWLNQPLSVGFTAQVTHHRATIANWLYLLPVRDFHPIVTATFTGHAFRITLPRFAKCEAWENAVRRKAHVK